MLYFGSNAIFKQKKKRIIVPKCLFIIVDLEQNKNKKNFPNDNGFDQSINLIFDKINILSFDISKESKIKKKITRPN